MKSLFPKQFKLLLWGMILILKINKKSEKFTVVEIKGASFLEFIIDVLDKGKSEIIALSKNLEIKTVVIDELYGRKYTRKHGLDTIGSLGILVLAKKKILITGIVLYLDMMLAN